MSVNEITGENIVYGNNNTGPGCFDPTVIVEGWMDSPGQRGAILNGRFEEIGAGYATTPGARDRRQQAAGHYHVPVLVSLFGYSTYLGS